MKLTTFRKVYSLWHELHQQGMTLDTLSMGMSDDFEAAIAEGATMIRLGKALWGKEIF
jgi:PLP dependent protein